MMKILSGIGHLPSLARALWKNQIPGQLIIQLTDRCNARCPQCGMRVSETYPRSRLAQDDVKRMLDTAALRGVQMVSFTGGEPLLLLDDLLVLMKYAGKASMKYIRTGTNGFIFMHSRKKGFTSRIRHIAEALAATPLRNFWISVDSALPDIHEKMRGFPGVIRGIEKTLPILHDCGIYPSANLGLNRNITYPPLSGQSDPLLFYSHFREALRAFYAFVMNLGFTMVNYCYPMGLIRKYRQDPEALKLWIDDLRYFRACGYFNGRQPPDMERLGRFK